jgi:hypothetical protein
MSGSAYAGRHPLRHLLDAAQVEFSGAKRGKRRLEILDTHYLLAVYPSNRRTQSEVCGMNFGH